jgi:hypothetical protein
MTNVVLWSARWKSVLSLDPQGRGLAASGLPEEEGQT